jgi:hypothetical protein
MRIHRTSVSGYQTAGRAVSGFLVLLLLGLTSCSESTQPTTGLDASHGAIAVSVYVKQDVSGAAPTTSVLAATFNPPIDCASLGIVDVTIQVQDSGGSVRGSDDFACTDHKGTLTGIPSGSGYTVTVIGRPSANRPTLWQGEVTGITVTPNSTVQASVGLDRIPWGKTSKENNVAVSVALSSQINPGLAPDGSGGAFIVWEDNRNGISGIYAQHLDGLGLPQGRENGLPMGTVTHTQRNPKIVARNNGFPLVVWEDTRTDVSDLYLGEINFTGNFVNVHPLLVKAGNAQKNQQIVSDGAGGHIIVWEDDRDGPFDIYAQRLDSNNSRQWGDNGRVVSQAANEQTNPQLISDRDEGAIIVWEDTRNGTADIYAQRINRNGVPQWIPAEGVVVSLALNKKTVPQLVSDGVGGAIIVWQGERTGISGVYAQRIDSEGKPKWTSTGVVVRQDSFDSEGPGSYAPELVSDDNRGAIIGWRQQEADQHIFAQRLNENGERVQPWPSSGVHVSPETFGRPRLISDRVGGAIFTYISPAFVEGAANIYAQRLNSDGVTQWFVTVSDAVDDQLNPGIVEDGGRGAILAWQDFRSGTNFDIYAQGITATGAK